MERFMMHCGVCFIVLWFTAWMGTCLHHLGN